MHLLYLCLHRSQNCILSCCLEERKLINFVSVNVSDIMNLQFACWCLLGVVEEHGVPAQTLARLRALQARIAEVAPVCCTERVGEILLVKGIQFERGNFCSMHI
jgi:hypothetical protein